MVSPLFSFASSSAKLNLNLSINVNAKFFLPGMFSVKCGSAQGIMAGGCHRPMPGPICFPKPGCGSPAAPKEEEWTVCQGEDGKATIDLGDNYSLELNEHRSQLIITNKHTGEKTNIWGDPHVDWNGDGKTDVDFWGKTTFQLEDGTKITIDTEKWKGNDDMYVANDITITKGDNAIQIKGLSQNEVGDMEINQSDIGGQVLDWAVTDGFVVEENQCGEGWINPESGEMATQEDFNVTKPGAEKPYEFTQQFGQALGMFLMTGFMEALYACDCKPSSGWREGVVTHASPPNDGLSRIQLHEPVYTTGNGSNSLAIHYADGTSDIRTDGSLSWRTNNPGLLPYDAHARSHGAIGEVDGVAVFASLQGGKDALHG